MTPLPFQLPTCGQPATVRLEVYSPVDGVRDGSLDASVYTCQQHATPAVDAVRAAGMNAFPVPLAPDVARTCGESFVFPTGALAGPEQPQHPTWCDRKGCADRLEHRSRQLTANPTGSELYDLRAALVQLTAAPDVTLIELAFTDGPGDTDTRVMPLAQAIALSTRIRRLADWSAGRQS